MKKLIYLLMLIFLSVFTTAYNECKGTMTYNDVPCYVLLPVNITVTPCTTLNVTIYNKTTKLISNKMATYSPYFCYTNFSYTTYGTYNFFYSTGDTGTIIMQEDVDNRYYLYVIAIVAMIFFLVLGYLKHDGVFLIMSAFCSFSIAISIWTFGFPYLTNAMLKTTILMTFIGYGIFYILYPSLEFIEGNI